MKILVVGSGAREHALVWKLSQEAEVFAAPGNPGISTLCDCFPVPAMDLAGQVALAKRLSVDLVVVGPEDPLIAGLADALRNAGLATFGPGAEGARLEGSKAFSKDLMKEAGIPTAAYGHFTDPVAAREFVDSRMAAGRNVVVKASGAALGKGVTVCNGAEDAYEAVDFALVRKGFGEAGSEIVVEDRLGGREFSLLTLCSDGGFLSLPIAQDYKRIYDRDEGPNTGGMGSYSPVPWISEETVAKTEATVVQPLLDTLKKRGISYRGVLFSGLMVDQGKISCLEYNVRFGDPETQSVMARLGSGLAAALLACAKGEPIPPIEVLANAAVSIVIASGGYPGPIQKGIPIVLGDLYPNTTLFHAGTAWSKDVPPVSVVEGHETALVTNGGRVITVTATGLSLPGARTLAYEAAKSVCFSGIQYRSDIAAL